MTRTCLITGSSRGLGLQLVHAFLEAGYNVVATARSPGKLAAKLPQRDDLRVVALDVTDPQGVEAAVDEAIRAFGTIDVLINSAGHAQLGFFEMTRQEAIRQEFEVNLFGPMTVTRAVLPWMRAQGSGLLVTISSSSGLVSAPGGAVYSSSKFALEGWIAGLADEVAGFGIRSIVVNPGMMRTDFLDASSARHGDIEIADYTEAACQFRAFIEGANHQQPGNPTELARRLARLAGEAEPPKRVLFGEDAEDAVRTTIAALSADLA
ncbi:MAG: SDR family oxidoreductase [Rhodobacteraceae bacterium]|nr:SDR family oxidoreductase [Paracoccaceae bacterium]MBR9822543.1 SDR family oxidoreductase [Paracoccaceae bacterium]